MTSKILAWSLALLTPATAFADVPGRPVPPPIPAQYAQPYGGYGVPYGSYGAPYGSYGAPYGAYGAPNGYYGAPGTPYASPPYGGTYGNYGGTYGNGLRRREAIPGVPRTYGPGAAYGYGAPGLSAAIGQRPMPDGAFRGLLAAVQQQPYDPARLDVLRSVAGRVLLSTKQLRQLVAQFQDEGYAAAAVESLASGVVDPQNAGALVRRFQDPATRQQIGDLFFAGY
jgi:hypothetical protein